MVKSLPVNNKIGPITFVKQSIAELKKVNWPTKKTVLRLTGVVIGVSLAVGALIGGLDYIFTKIVGWILL